MSVDVVTPEEHLGGVIGDLQRRRANIADVTSRGEMSEAKALVPLRLMFGYATDLRSLTKGRANFSMEFHAYDSLEP